MLPFSSVVVVIPPHIYNPYPKPTSTSMMTNFVTHKAKRNGKQYLLFALAALPAKWPVTFRDCKQQSAMMIDDDVRE